MPSSPHDLWTLVGFIERLDQWIDLEAPSQDVRLVTTAWVLSRRDDPYRGVRREPGFDNLWFGVVPNSGDSNGRVVACSYWIEETARTLRCDSFATLSYPA